MQRRNALAQTAAGGGDTFQLARVGDDRRGGIEVRKAHRLPDGFGQRLQPCSGGGADCDRAGHKGCDLLLFPRREGGGEILLIENGDGGPARKLRQPFPFLRGQGAAFIKDRQHQVALLQRPAAALHPQLLHRVLAFAQARGILQAQHQIAQPHRFLHDIPGGAGDGGDDAALPSRKEIHQGGFADIGAADDGGGDALPHQPPLLPALLQPGQRLLHPGKLPQQHRRGDLLHILLGVVDPGGNVGAAIGEGIGGGHDLPVQGALHGAQRRPQALAVLRRQDIDDAFRFGEGHAAVHQRAAGVLPGLGRTRPRGNHRGQHLRQHKLPAVAAKLGHVLAGVAVGSVVDEQHRLIQQLLPAVDAPERPGVAGHPFRVLGGIQRAEHLPRDGQRLRPGKAHDAYPASDGGGDGGDGITHGEDFLSEGTAGTRAAGGPPRPRAGPRRGTARVEPRGARRRGPEARTGGRTYYDRISYHKTARLPMRVFAPVSHFCRFWVLGKIF